MLGRINNEQFRMLSDDYNAEQKSLKERIPQTAERIQKLQASVANVTRFIDKARRYTEINELSGELLNLFVEKIEVGERGERYSRTAEQEIIIHYRDIGVVGAFAEEAEKIAEQWLRQTAFLLSASTITHGSHYVPMNTGPTRQGLYFCEIHLQQPRLSSNTKMHIS